MPVSAQRASQRYSPYKRARYAHGDARAAQENLPLNDLPLPASHPRPPRQVFICGDGSYGQLGMGTEVTGEISRPRLHPWFELAVQGNLLGDGNGASIEAACAGAMHSLVIDEVGRVWSWGVNDSSALGRQTVNVRDPDAPDQFVDTTILESQPLLVQTLVHNQFRAVRAAAGDNVSVVLNHEGSIRAWGGFRSADGPLGFNHDEEEEESRLEPMKVDLPSDSRVVQVVCGSNHVLFLTQEGTVFGWGNGEHAELGRKLVERRKRNGLIPMRVLLRRIVCIGAGAYHSFAVKEDGTVLAWGLNAYRQLGITFDEDNEDVEKDIIWAPVEVRALSPKSLGQGRRVVHIAGGEHHTLFLLNDGSVYGCGRCDGSELGLPDDHPEIAAFGSDSSSSDSSRSGRTSSSGAFAYIAAPTLIRFPPPPTPLDSNPSISSFYSSSHSNPMARIAASSRHSFAVSRTGHAYAWGLGYTGELGLGGKIEEQKTPKRVSSRELDELLSDGQGWKWFIEDVSAGAQHTLLIAKAVE